MFCRFPLACSLLLAAAALLAGGCNKSTPPGPSAQVPAGGSKVPRAFTSAFTSPRDDLGREIKLTSPARRVLVIGPGAVETIFTLGAGERIVGRDSGTNFPAEAVKNIAVVADFHGPFIEACVAARPDLVLAQGETWNRERIEQWQAKIGAPVAALVPSTVDDVQKDADKIAAWLGASKRALNLNPPLKDVDMGGKTAFIEISRSPLWTSGKNTLVSDVVEQGQFKNVASDVAGYKAFSKEALLQRQPDVYITTGEPKDKARILAELKSDAALGSLKCVQRGQVLVLPGDFLLRPGPRLRLGIQALKKVARHPDEPAQW